MKLSILLLKWLCPAAEHERCEFRQDLHRAQAHAEELNRAVAEHRPRSDNVVDLGLKKQQKVGR